VPARPGKAVLTPKRFAEMEALSTSAGVAIVPFTDDLSVQVQSEIVTVSRPRACLCRGIGRQHRARRAASDKQQGLRS